MTSYTVEPNATVDTALAIRQPVARETAREPRSDLARPIGLPRTVAEGPLLRMDNTRIYYIPREDEDLKGKVVRALQAGPGASFTLNGNAADAYNGQVIALVLPPARFCGFAQLDFQPGGSSESLASGTACVLKAFEAVPANSFDGIKGLFFNPAILSVPFGKKVSELPNRSGITWPYSPESAKEVLTTLWLNAGGSFDGALPRRKRAAGQHTSTEDASRTKAPNREMLQLNKTILLEQLRTVGFSQQRAQEVLQQQSNKGWVFVTKVDGQEGTHEFQIFRPRASAPCVTDTELARLYNKLALLWMEELERPQPRAVAQSRNTRLHERAAAEQQERLRTEGLSPIQLQQVTDAVNAAIKPVVDAQQQQGARVEAVAVGYASFNTTCSQLQQMIPTLAAFSDAYNQQVLGQPGAVSTAAGAI